MTELMPNVRPTTARAGTPLIRAAMGSCCVAMGHYYFTDYEGNKPLKVEYTFGYQKDGSGSVKIFSHHSSLPNEA